MSAGKRDKGMDRERKLIVENNTNLAGVVATCPVCGVEIEAGSGIAVFEMSCGRPMCEGCVDRHGLALQRWFGDGARSAPLHR